MYIIVRKFEIAYHIFTIHEKFKDFIESNHKEVFKNVLKTL